MQMKDEIDVINRKQVSDLLFDDEFFSYHLETELIIDDELRLRLLNYILQTDTNKKIYKDKITFLFNESPIIDDFEINIYKLVDEAFNKCLKNFLDAVDTDE